jgi:hypothetical protein
MSIRNFVLCGVSTLLAIAAGQALARPAIPNPETPPLTVQFDATYFSNIAGSNAAFAAARGLKREDQVYSPSANLNFVEPMGGLSLFLAGQAGYVFHQQNSVLDRERINLQGGADAQLDVCQATLVGSFSRQQSDLIDLNVGTTKNTQQIVSAEMDAVCNQSGVIVPSLSVVQSWSTDSAPQYKIQDYRSLGVNGSLQYNAGDFGAISLIGSYVRTDYPHRFFLIGGVPETDGYNLYSGGIHYERTFDARFDLGLSLSESSLSPDNGVGPGFDGLTYDASLTYHPDARLSFNLDFSRAANPSNRLGASYSVDQIYRGSVSYRITSRLTATLGAQEIHRDLKGAALLIGTDISRETDHSYYGSLAFNATPTFSVSLNAGQDQRHADVLGYSYSGAHVGLSLSKAF